MLGTSRMLRNWKETGRISLLLIFPENARFQDGPLHLCQTPRFWMKCHGYVTNSCVFGRNPRRVYTASLSVGTLVWPFLAALRSFGGSVETSPDEVQMADEILNKIICSIESNDLSDREIHNDIERLCRSGSRSSLDKLLKFLREKHVYLGSDTYNILLAAASERGEIELAVEIFMDFLMSSKCPSSKSYFNIAKAFAKTDDCVQLLKFVREISGLTFPRSVLVMNRTIFAFAECGQIEKALIIFDHMKSLKCNPDLVTYNTIIGILGRAGRVDDMLHVFASMKEANIIPDVVSYNTLLNILHKFGRLDLCLVYMREMDESGLMPDLRTYTALIESFGRSGNVEESLRLFNAMKHRQVKPSIYVYRSLINNLKKMGKLQVAASLWEEMNSSLPNLVGPKDFKRKNR